LPLKPVLTISDGRVRFFGATTAKAKSIDKVLKVMKDTWDENLPEIGILHADCLAEAEELKKKVNQFLPSSRVFVSECSPIIGYATGRGSLLIAFFAK
jgi:fatty acid-binding protein DegV